jgi:hypothetical protein
MQIRPAGAIDIGLLNSSRKMFLAITSFDKNVNARSPAKAEQQRCRFNDTL